MATTRLNAALDDAIDALEQNHEALRAARVRGATGQELRALALTAAAVGRLVVSVGRLGGIPAERLARIERRAKDAKALADHFEAPERPELSVVRGGRDA